MRAFRVPVMAAAGFLELVGLRLRRKRQRCRVPGASDSAIGAAAVCARAVSRRRLATVLRCKTRPGGIAFILAGLLISFAGCGDGDDVATSTDANTARSQAATSARGENPDSVTKIGGDRSLYVRCTGAGSPTVVMEGGDEDTSDSYSFAEASIAEVTRACVYDRANLGRSGPDPGPRGLPELVGDVERLLQAAQIPGPYVLVGTSGGGYITAGYAYSHPRQIAGMVFVEVPAPFRNPPRDVVEATGPDNPANVEKRDYLQVEKDAWNARRRIGDIPVTIISDDPSEETIEAATHPSERRRLRRNVADQKGWLVLSPRARQIVVHTGHAVEEADPELVIDAILDVVKASR
jgi:pimeloyl-ACP methyl ester carboxylesterase